MRRSRITKKKQEKLLGHFVGGTTVRCTASIVGVNKSTTAYYFHGLREIIYHKLEQDFKVYVAGEGEIEVDERINHSELLADKKSHINRIENFWNQAKRHMHQFNGIPREYFH